MNVTSAKKANEDYVQFNLRYLGQGIANLEVKNNEPIISTKDFDDNNKRDFGCEIHLLDVKWNSKEAKEFRKYFISKLPTRNCEGNKGNEEHRIESLLLSEFSKKDSNGKLLCGIQPIKQVESARFQMPTPIKASSRNEIKYASQFGGGIDILARVGRNGRSKLCIIELKDENEPAEQVLKQALVYATFIRELLRSESGHLWWKLFGFNRPIDKKLKFLVACAMPKRENDDISFAKKIISLGEDEFELHYIYFKEKDNVILEINSSLN